MNITYADGAISGLRDFRAQLKRAPISGGIVYHTGEMWSLDKKLADAAMALFKEGRVHLVQKRVGTGPDEMPVRDYIAIKRKASDRSGEIRRHLQMVSKSAGWRYA